MRGGPGESRRQSRGDDRYQPQERKSSLYYNHHPPQVGETKILELEEELRVVANNLKSLEVMVMMAKAMIMMAMKGVESCGQQPQVLRGDNFFLSYIFS